MKLYYLLLGFIFFLSGCYKKKMLADPDDYSAFLKPGIIQAGVDKIEEQIPFWENRLQKDTGNFVDMLELASCHIQLFKLRGTVADLHKGDSLLKRSSSKLANKDPDILFALSQNSIAQHKFKDADFFNATAGEAGGEVYTNRLLEFDTKMELGESMIASEKLETLKDKSSFDYLIRKSKLEDQKGNLDGAIKLMEQAFEKIKNRKKNLYCWTLSNLADMYCHAGRAEDAYQTYLKVLRADSSYIYALKGIAWIVFSHDHNAKDAKRIYQYILSQTDMPDIFIILAEIEEWEGKNDMKKEYIRKFIRQAENRAYGNMYNKYLIQLYTEEEVNLEKALLLAEKEIALRATPETYEWLAWVYFNRGQKDQAFSVANNYVYKRNFEPGALFHTGLIFSGAGKKAEAGKLLEECLESELEIGPVVSAVVQQQLRKL